MFGRVLSTISDLCGTDITSLTAKVVKKNIKFTEVSYYDKWRINLAKNLLDMRNGAATLPGFMFDEIDDMLKYACHVLRRQILC